MVPLLLGLIACILLFGPFGVAVFAGIMICIFPFYLIKIILDSIKKHRRKPKVIVETQRGKVTLLYKDGRWIPVCGNHESYRSEEPNEEIIGIDQTVQR